MPELLMGCSAQLQPSPKASGCGMPSSYTVLVFKINLSLDWAQDLYWIQWLSAG